MTNIGMGTSINWARLEAAGRVKAVGVPWTLEEERAIQEGIPPEYVRLGILNEDDLEARKEEEAKELEETGVTPLINIDRETLLKIAHRLKINATAASDSTTLIRLIEQEDGEKADELVKEFKGEEVKAHLARKEAREKEEAEREAKKEEAKEKEKEEKKEAKEKEKEEKKEAKEKEKAEKEKEAKSKEGNKDDK